MLGPPDSHPGTELGTAPSSRVKKAIRMWGEEEIRDQLGEDIHKMAVRGLTSASPQQLTDIAAKMGEAVGWEFRRERRKANFEMGRSAARQVLSDWYKLERNCEVN